MNWVFIISTNANGAADMVNRKHTRRHKYSHTFGRSNCYLGQQFWPVSDGHSQRRGEFKTWDEPSTLAPPPTHRKRLGRGLHLWRPGWPVGTRKARAGRIPSAWDRCADGRQDGKTEIIRCHRLNQPASFFVLIEVKPTCHKFHHCEVYRSVAFRTSTILYNHHLYLVPEPFHHLTQKPCTHYAVTAPPHPPFSAALGNNSSTFCPHGLDHSQHLIFMEYTICDLLCLALFT